jgi:catechol 2,3-dioxygenase-like lactoylglutathione lyase family enzyme
MEMKLELVPIPVSDVDMAKAFYVEKVGFNLDHDVQPGVTSDRQYLLIN